MLDERDLDLDLFALGLLAFVVFLSLSLATYSPTDPLGSPSDSFVAGYQPDPVTYPAASRVQNACGRVGAITADVAFRLVGIGAYYVAACLTGVNVWLLMG